jgi:hypothetical protein
VKKVGMPNDLYTSRGCTTRINKWRTKLESMVGMCYFIPQHSDMETQSFAVSVNK